MGAFPAAAADQDEFKRRLREGLLTPAERLAIEREISVRERQAKLERRVYNQQLVRAFEQRMFE